MLVALEEIGHGQIFALFSLHLCACAYSRIIKCVFISRRLSNSSKEYFFFNMLCKFDLRKNFSFGPALSQCISNFFSGHPFNQNFIFALPSFLDETKISPAGDIFKYFFSFPTIDKLLFLPALKIPYYKRFYCINARLAKLNRKKSTYRFE